MLVLAVRSDAERVYQRALRYFTPDEIAEAFAATRGVASPTQLRAMMKRDGRDLSPSSGAWRPSGRPSPCNAGASVASASRWPSSPSSPLAGSRPSGCSSRPTTCPSSCRPTAAPATWSCSSPRRSVRHLGAVRGVLPAGWALGGRRSTQRGARSGSTPTSPAPGGRGDRCTGDGCDVTGATPVPSHEVGTSATSTPNSSRPSCAGPARTCSRWLRDLPLGLRRGHGPRRWWSRSTRPWPSNPGRRWSTGSTTTPASTSAAPARPAPAPLRGTTGHPGSRRTPVAGGAGSGRSGRGAGPSAATWPAAVGLGVCASAWSWSGTAGCRDGSGGLPRVNGLPVDLGPLWPVQQLGVLAPGGPALVAALRRWRLALALVAATVAKLVTTAVKTWSPRAPRYLDRRRGADAGRRSPGAARASSRGTPCGRGVGRGGRAVPPGPVAAGPLGARRVVLFARVYVGAHNPLDVVCGAASGWSSPAC